MSELIALLWDRAKKARDPAFDAAVFRVEDLLRASRQARHSLLESGKSARERGDASRAAMIEKRANKLTAALMPFGISS